MTVHTWAVYMRLLTPDPSVQGTNPGERTAHSDSCEVHALDPGTAARKAWIVAAQEIKSRNKKLPKISRVVFSVARKEANHA